MLEVRNAYVINPASADAVVDHAEAHTPKLLCQLSENPRISGLPDWPSVWVGNPSRQPSLGTPTPNSRVSKTTLKYPKFKVGSGRSSQAVSRRQSATHGPYIVSRLGTLHELDGHSSTQSPGMRNPERRE